MVIIYLRYQQSLVINENQNYKTIPRYKLIVLTKNDLYQKYSLINTYNTQKNYKGKVSKESHIFFKIFKKIRKIQQKICNIYKK